MNKKVLIPVIIILVILLVIGGIFIFKPKDSKGTTKNNSAKLGISELVEAYNNTELIKSMASSDGKNTIEAVLDENNNKINISLRNDVILSFNYNNDYIYYNVSNNEITEETTKENRAVSMYGLNIFDAITYLIKGKDAKFDRSKLNMLNANFETDGYEIVGEQYNLTQKDSKENNINVSGYYIKSLKISINPKTMKALSEK